MKRNLILTIAVAAFMLASEFAWAADVSFSGQFRPRFIIDEDHDSTTTAAHIFDTRVRLNAKANVNANTEVFLQFQSVGNWGVANADTSGTRVSTGGGGTQASDALNDVGFHQAFVTLKDFAGTSFDAKIGRQEVVLDGHRLFGHTGWTTGAETKDAIRLTHSGGNHTVNLIYIAGANADSVNNSNAENENMYVLHLNTQGVLGGSLSGYFVATNDDIGDGADSGVPEDDQWYTIGARQAGKLGSLDYRVEFYHQFGEASNAAERLTGYNYDATTGVDIDREAHLFGVRVGHTFKNVPTTPTLTIWYDRLSGSDDDDITANEYGTFDTLSDTGHKFYGFQDFFLNSSNSGTQGLGLQDLAMKMKMNPAAGWTFKADWHWFKTSVNPEGADADTFVANNDIMAGAYDNDLGHELDLTLAHKYDANTKIVTGYSHYWTSRTMGEFQGDIGGDNSNGAHWFYVMADTKF